MAVGLQCFNAAGSFQIDGTYPQFVLRRKVVVTTNTWVDGNNGYGYSTGTVTVAGDEVVALASSVACGVTVLQGTSLRLVSLGATGTSITVYVFGQITTTGSGVGLQVFNTSGAVVFDSTQKPLVMVGFPIGEGNFSYGAGRSFAAMCINQYLKVVDTRTFAGGFESQRLQITQGLVKSISGGLNISNALLYDTTNVFDPNQTDVDRTIPAGTPNRHIAVDVTYL
jgi:hypothetical protein